MTRRARTAIPADETRAERALALARTIDDAVALYRAAFPEDWAACQNWPLQHALPHVAAKLRSLGA